MRRAVCFYVFIGHIPHKPYVAARYSSIKISKKTVIELRKLGVIEAIFLKFNVLHCALS